MPRAPRASPAAQPAPRAGASKAAPGGWSFALSPALRTGLLYAGVLVKVPVTLFFACQLVVFPVLLGLSAEDSSFYACVVAISVLNLLFVAFVYLLWHEARPGPPPPPADEE